MKRNDIIKALECCASEGCESCPYSRMPTAANCVLFTMSNALSLIKELTEEVASWKEITEGYQKQFEDCAEDRARLTEENERLRTEVYVKKKLLDKCVDLEDKVKADTVRKMQERFIAEIEQTPNANEHFIKAWKSKIDQIAKEMLEGKKE